jgi:mono/diheme cytochrome c family protein
MKNLPRRVVSVLALSLVLPSGAVAQEIGKASFMANCAVCHGADGKGNGPIVDMLTNGPSDLTKIAAENGGTFPIETIYNVIADPDQNRAHGTSEMPIWGNRFNDQIIAQEGEFGVGGSAGPTAQAQILELVYFLATIQEL